MTRGTGDWLGISRCLEDGAGVRVLLCIGWHEGFLLSVPRCEREEGGGLEG